MNDQQATPTTSVATADKRREDMIRAALDVIVERGYPDTRIADVAERAGTSPALVIYYFTTKDNLLTEAVRLAEDHWYDLGAARMAAIGTAAGRLEWIVAATCLPQADEELPEPWALWLDLWAQAVRHPEVARVRADFDARWRATIADVVVEGEASGEFSPVDPNEFAVTLSALLDGFAVQIALEDPVVDPDTAFACAMRFAADRLGFAWAADGRSGAPAAGRGGAGSTGARGRGGGARR
jgi:AcrR family transcriptional regulator